MERIWNASELNISRHATLTRVIRMSDPSAELRADDPVYGGKCGDIQKGPDQIGPPLLILPQPPPPPPSSPGTSRRTNFSVRFP